MKWLSNQSQSLFFLLFHSNQLLNNTISRSDKLCGFYIYFQITERATWFLFSGRKNKSRNFFSHCPEHFMVFLPNAEPSWILPNFFFQIVLIFTRLLRDQSFRSKPKLLAICMWFLPSCFVFFFLYPTLLSFFLLVAFRRSMGCTPSRLSAQLWSLFLPNQRVFAQFLVLLSLTPSGSETRKMIIMPISIDITHFMIFFLILTLFHQVLPHFS